jgi:hypothetical protein
METLLEGTEHMARMEADTHLAEAHEASRNPLTIAASSQSLQEATRLLHIAVSALGCPSQSEKMTPPSPVHVVA